MSQIGSPGNARRSRAVLRGGGSRPHRLNSPDASCPRAGFSEEDRQSMSYAKALPNIAARAIVLIAGGLTLTACDSLASLNPFGGEKYKMEIVPDVPANKLYDEG